MPQTVRRKMVKEVVSGTDTTARGTRALPVQLHRSG